jgi:hypothetical protein
MISLDATSSGLQLLAALTGESFAAMLCNVLATGGREDAYQGIYRYMLNQIGDTSKIAPEDVKQAVMTAFYSSKAVPKQVFGEGSLLDLFYQTLENLAPGAWALNEAMLSLWDSDTDCHSWVLPDNFHVHIPVMSRVRETVHFLNQPFDIFYNVNAPIEQGRSLGANTIHSIDGMIVRELTRRCDYNPKTVERLTNLLHISNLGVSTIRKKDQMVRTLWDHYLNSGYLSARILDYLDHANMGLVDRQDIKNLLESLPPKPFKVVSIHDCFRVLPHYGNDLRHQYNLQLQLIAKSNLLSHLVSQLVGRTVPVMKQDPTMWVKVINADYALS